MVKETVSRSVGASRMGSNPIPCTYIIKRNGDVRVVKEKVLRTFGAIRVGSIPTPRKLFLEKSLAKKFDKIKISKNI